MFPAPIVMGYLVRQKQELGVGADHLGGILGGAQPRMPAARSGEMFDRDGDGGPMDDIASIAFDFPRNR